MSDQVLWQPTPQRIAESNMTAFEQALTKQINNKHSSVPMTYQQWHTYSTKNPAEFWRFYLRYSGLPVARGEDPNVAVLSDAPMPEVRWFEGATVNYAEAMLYPPAAAGKDISEQTAIMGIHENGTVRRLTYGELRAAVAACAAALQSAGVTQGDRVAAVMGNVPEAVILLCACAAIGAVFSSCSPDFGEQAAVARFGQIQPKLLFAQPSYSYHGRRYDIVPMIKKLAACTAGWENTIFISDGADAENSALPKQQQWQHWLQAGAGAPLSLVPLPFDHPLYILYSSGTTGMPKAIVHRTGGVMLKHHSEHYLHSDIRPGDYVLYYTTCGWMMWNWLVSVLMQAATIVLYEGSPAYPSLDILWQVSARYGITFLGVSARFIQSSRVAAESTNATGVAGNSSTRADLSALRTIASTGSPLSPAGFEWVYQNIREDVHLASISGGTDIVGCFMLGNPNHPVIAGQIQVPAAGVDVAAVDENGEVVYDQPGELISRVPFPSMPLEFWQDEQQQRYRAAYFSHLPGVWWHGDMLTVTRSGGMIVHGRSDATLNPGGVRIGSADIYRPLEQIPEVLDAAAVGKKTEDGDEEIWLLVVLQKGLTLDEELQTKIKTVIRAAASPRHVPRRIVAVAQLPRTRSGKTTELAVGDIVNGRTVNNRAVMANPEALDEIAAAIKTEC